MTPPPAQDPPRDWRAVIVILAGLFVVLVIVVLAAIELPGDVPRGMVNTKAQSIVAIATAAFSAITSAIAAYFGIKAANLAREDSQKQSQDHAIEVAHLAGAAEPTAAKQAINDALAGIAELRSK